MAANRLDDPQFEPAAPEEPRSFATFLTQVEDGQLHADLSTAIRDIAAGLSNHVIDFGGKPKAKLTLTIDFELDGGVFEIRGDVKTVMPRRPRSRSIFYATAGNNLTQQNPRQGQLFAPGPVRTV